MKTLFTLCLAAVILATTATPSPAQGVFDRIKNAAKDKVNQQVDDKTNAAMDSSVDKAEGAAANRGKPSSKAADESSASSQPAGAASSDAAAAADTPAAAPVTISAYQNYDFTPGGTILFADDFTTTQDGEFPDQWELVKGQGVVNKQQGYQAFLLTDGNYAQVRPRVKTKNYLGPQYTVEYDTFFTSASSPVMAFFEEADNESYVSIGPADATYNGPDSYSLYGSLPDAISGEAYAGRWHHVALAIKNHQLKVYVDQYRVLTVPDMHTTPESLMMGGIGSQEGPLIFRNVRIASGGGMNMIGQKFTDARIVTHGINFDVDRATLRPESMGTLNQIKRILADNPDLKFEIDGHTDNSGPAARNLTLSQQRADAVKAQLVQMGVAASRLTTKGYGDTKPMTDNSTPEGKANNRRVEFVRVS